MAFGAPTSNNDARYVIELQHSSGVRMRVTADMPLYLDGNAPPEATRDAIVQAFVTTLATIPNTTVASAVKRGSFSAAITP